MTKRRYYRIVEPEEIVNLHAQIDPLRAEVRAHATTIAQLHAKIDAERKQHDDEVNQWRTLYRNLERTRDLLEGQIATAERMLADKSMLLQAMMHMARKWEYIISLPSAYSLRDATLKTEEVFREKS